ncbi:MAG: 50S ribosomal protein L32 [Candidatus Moranbacteria bacterium CG_4_9_14_3_um_filter_40_7]|nr:MAG: 50S ribosomal protein L32 [Candidatus Moranbacteria bacterium CG23_combo_of_CG06-09_8_20_14_all_40_16]PIU80748.1 MAG: 50S ribosomal protein L32 [Candidatus Moranbacteria bacterium CG06_land_8_20_14_3_00_40_12]PJA87511.1 MAG: 50S ribosomal protein L32 [Candidatus Moranbacteria bacterium CG_4_9_14_3_um_filter_40_7]
MSTQKQRHTKARRDRARKELKLKVKKLVVCSHCQAEIIAHKVCSQCGYYKGKEAVNTLKKIKKK